MISVKLRHHETSTAATNDYYGRLLASQLDMRHVLWEHGAMPWITTCIASTEEGEEEEEAGAGYRGVDQKTRFRLC